VIGRRRLRRRPDALDRARGALLGLAVGDALGAPLEWLHPDQIHARYGGPLSDMVASQLWERGEWTDDTAMALELAASLAARGGWDEEDVLARYLIWARSSPKDIGATVAAALRGARSADEARGRAAAYHAERGRSAGNGTVMRTPPIAVRYVDSEVELERVARADSALTHHDPLAGEAAAYLNLTIAALIRGGRRPRRSWRSAAAAESALEASDAELLADVQTHLGFALTALRVGFAAAFRHDRFEDAVAYAVNFGGDADTNGAVAGALAGARFGAAGIPLRWLEPLRGRERIAGLAARLFRG
jgi:ADP-ribosyl-[dinitrogen reductase] hydrolase